MSAGASAKVTPLRRQPEPEKVEFNLTGRRKAVPAARPVALPASADRFEWARAFRREVGPKPSEKVLAQVIAEAINADPKHPRYGTAWKSRPTMAEEGGLALKTVDEALAVMKRRGFIKTRKQFGGTLQITLAMPENHQSRGRAQDWDEEHANLADGGDTISRTGASSISRTGAKYLSTYLNRYQKEEALEEDLSSDCSSLYPREVRRLWSEADNVLPAPEGDEHAEQLLRFAITEALGLPASTPADRVAAEFRRIPTPTQSLLLAELSEGYLTIGALAEVLIKYGASQERR